MRTTLTAGILLSSVAIPAMAERYSVRQMLPVPGRSHDESYLSAIDDAGNAVGGSRSSSNATVGVGQVLRVDGIHASTGMLADCLPYGGSGISGVSPGGRFAGSASAICGGFGRPMHGLVADPAAFQTFAPLAGGGDAFAYDSNGLVIVGWSNLQSGCPSPLCVFTNGRPMKWAVSGGGGIVLPFADYVAAAAYGVNRSGVVVGVGLTQGSFDFSQAVRWDTDTSIPVVLPAVQGSYSYAFRISDAGVVVGESQVGSNRLATKWIGTAPTNLGTLPTHNTSSANDIDDRRGIVGSSGPSPTATRTAVLWRDGQIIDLNSRLTDAGGVVLTSADGINASGWIAANGVYQGRSFGFVLVPCFADLNEDDVVDDADFQFFAAAYNILDCADPLMPSGCPADLNRDGFVDDEDFQVFAAAYNELLCP